MNKQTHLRFLMSAGIATLILPATMALAATGDTQQANSYASTQQSTSQQTDPVQVPQLPVPKVQDDQTFPYQTTFVISAYYSPIANQKKYVTGSYKGDIRLNGGGVHAADGSPVYPGMVAAPKNYPFGTKMKIPGVGVVAVHDRGGAIVNAGQRNQSHDRLDVWMGYGDAGLQRALHWGRRTVEVTVYGVNPSVQENVYLEGYSEAEKIAEAATGEAPQTFVEDLSVNDKSNDVTKLQTGLKQLGYYNGELNGTYDDSTKQAVVKFQVSAGIVDSENDFGAGYLGPQTRKSLEDALNQRNVESTQHIPHTTLTRDDQGADVSKLQEALKKLGYDLEVTGIYDNQTIDAILKFQKDQKVVSSDADFGAGVFGPRTMQVLASKLSGITFDTANAEESTIIPVIVFTKDLKLGDKGEDVRKLQDELRRMNYLGIDSSGYYGEVTRHAVLKFQQSQGLVDSPDDTAAGYFGQATRSRIHSIIGQRQHVDQLMADKNPPSKKEEMVAVK